MERRPVEMKPIPDFPRVPIYELAPPIAIPPLPQDKFVFDIDDYLDASARCGKKYDEIGTSLELKAVILDEIRKYEVMWKVRNQPFKTVREECCEVAAGVYRRTEVMLSIRKIWKFLLYTKNQLRCRLHKAMVKDKKTLLETEETLWKWDMYGYCRFLRPSFDTYTTERAMGNAITLNDDDNDEDEDFEDDDDETGDDDRDEVATTRGAIRPAPTTPSVESHPAHESREVAQEERLRSLRKTTQRQSALSRQRSALNNSEDSGSTEGNRKRRGSSFVSDSVVQTPAAKRTALRNSEPPRRTANDEIEHQEAHRQQLAEANVSQAMEPINFFRPSPFSVSPQNRSSFSRESSILPNQPAMPAMPTLPALDEEDFHAIDWYLRKAVRDQPEKSRLLRGAILQIISRIETRVCNSLEDVFKDLAK